jgi:hypothetical protein
MKAAVVGVAILWRMFAVADSLLVDFSRAFLDCIQPDGFAALVYAFWILDGRGIQHPGGIELKLRAVELRPALERANPIDGEGELPSRSLAGSNGGLEERDARAQEFGVSDRVLEHSPGSLCAIVTRDRAARPAMRGDDFFRAPCVANVNFLHAGMIAIEKRPFGGEFRTDTRILRIHGEKPFPKLLIHEGERSISGFGFLRDVPFGEARAFAEEELLHLLFHDFLRVGIERVQAVFVHDHLGVLEPHLPGFSGDVFVDALAEFPFPGNAIKAGHLAPEFHAFHHADILAGGRSRNCRWLRVGTFFVGHECLPEENRCIAKILQAEKEFQRYDRETERMWMASDSNVIASCGSRGV